MSAVRWENNFGEIMTVGKNYVSQSLIHFRFTSVLLCREERSQAVKLKVKTDEDRYASMTDNIWR